MENDVNVDGALGHSGHDIWSWWTQQISVEALSWYHRLCTWSRSSCIQHSREPVKNVVSNFNNFPWTGRLCRSTVLPLDNRGFVVCICASLSTLSLDR